MTAATRPLSSSSRRTHEAVVDELSAAGVRATFGLMGEDTAEMTLDLERVGIDYFAARHENVAVNMASGYAWASGSLGVCILSRGPGVTNAATALGTAAHQPGRFLAIVGDTATGGPLNRADLKARVDTRTLATSLGLAFRSPASPDEVPATMREAIAMASGGRPTMLALPVDVLASETDAPLSVDAAPRPPEATPAGSPRAAGPSEEDVRLVAELLEKARSPLLIAGGGAVEAGARPQLETLAERVGALLGTTLVAKDLFRGSPFDFGIVGGFTDEAGREVLDSVDCVVVFGASLTPYTTAFGHYFKGIPLVRFDLGPAGSHIPVTYEIVADAALAADRLLAAIPEAIAGPHPLHRDAIRESANRPGRFDGDDRGTGDAIDPRTLCVELDALLPADRLVSSDSGYCCAFPAMHVHVPDPSRYHLPQGINSIGMGLGTAIGIAAAVDGPQNVLFVGDGALAMTLGDLASVAERRLPITIVVLNDGAYGAERHFLDLAGLPNDRAALTDIDFAMVAAGMGIESATVRSRDDLQDVRGLLTVVRREPLLLDCKIVPDVRLAWIEELA